MNERKAECVVLTILGSTFPRLLIREIFPCKFACQATTRENARKWCAHAQDSEDMRLVLFVIYRKELKVLTWPLIATTWAGRITPQAKVAVQTNSSLAKSFSTIVRSDLVVTCRPDNAYDIRNKLIDGDAHSCISSPKKQRKNKNL